MKGVTDDALNSEDTGNTFKQTEMTMIYTVTAIEFDGCATRQTETHSFYDARKQANAWVGKDNNGNTEIAVVMDENDEVCYTADGTENW